MLKRKFTVVFTTTWKKNNMDIIHYFEEAVLLMLKLCVNRFISLKIHLHLNKSHL